MTAFKSPALAIADRLAANFATLPIVGDNDDGDDLDLTSGFVQLRINFVDSNFASINHPTPLVRGLGVIEFNINTALNVGVEEGIDFADTISIIFRGQSFGSVVCFSPTIDGGRQATHKAGQFWETPLICAFKYDENFTIS